MANNQLTALTGAVIFTGEAFVEGHSLLLGNGKILDIAPQNSIPAEAKKLDCHERILIPGFIDCQVNGGGNMLLNNSPTPEAAIGIAKAHARYGTTRILPTCITDKPEVMLSAIDSVRTARQTCPNILGIHLEGPHLSTERRGVHHADYLRDLTAEDITHYKPHDGGVMLVTLAPERATPEQISKLRQQGVIISLGHTAADAVSIRKALAAGATGFTHLFNGMGGLSARNPGPAAAALDDANSWCGLIADGYHVSPEMIRLALRAKPEGKIFLVSDAMPPSASEASLPFKLYGETIHVEGNRCQTADGKFAGAKLTLADAVKYCIDKAGIAPTEALRMASTNAAAFLGLDKKLGKLLPNFTADIVALDHQFVPQAVWVEGDQVL